MTTADINQIIVGERHRRDMGDIAALAESIRRIGLLNPITVTPDYRLIAGGRRLEALRQLGRTEVPIRIAANLSDVRQMLEAERDENTCREDMKPSEKVALGLALEALEKPNAEERKAEGQKAGGRARHGQLPANLAPSRTGEVREIVSSAVGMSKTTYDRAKFVVKKANDPEASPEVREEAAAALRQMDKTGKVAGAYNRVAAVTGRTATHKDEAQEPTANGRRRMTFSLETQKGREVAEAQRRRVAVAINSIAGYSGVADDAKWDLIRAVMPDDEARALAGLCESSIRALRTMKRNLTRREDD